MIKTPPAFFTRAAKHMNTSELNVKPFKSGK